MSDTSPPTPAPTPTPESLAYELEVNGRRRSVPSAWLGESLLYVLRERLGLPGSKNACDQGECGSCSVLLDGVLVCSCCVLAADAVDSDVRTVEGLADSDEPDAGLTDVQQAFLDTGAVQCGFCTPGLLVAVHDLLERTPDADQLEVQEALSGNLCRCTGYGAIWRAVERVQRGRGGSDGPTAEQPEAGDVADRRSDADDVAGDATGGGRDLGTRGQEGGR